MPDLAKVSSAAAEVAVLSDEGGTRVKSAAAEVAVLSDEGGTRVKSAAAEVAVLSDEGGTRVKGATAEVALIDTILPNIVLPDTSGQPAQSVTFNASASIVESYKWSWSSVPGGSSIANLSESYPDGTTAQGTEMPNGTAVAPVAMPDGTSVTPVAMPDSQATTPVDMTDNVLLLHMDGSADDDSGEGNNGTVSGATQVAGRVGSGAYQFNGTSDVITIPNTADLSMGAGVSWSICAWVKPTLATTGWEGFLYHGSAAENQILFARSSAGYFAAGNGNGSGSGSVWKTSISDQFLYSNIWYHLAAVVDRSANTITLYVNGRQVKTEAWTHLPSATTANSTVGQGNSAAETFGGVIDELAVWRRALSASEIQGIYDLQKGWETATTPIDMEANEALYHLEGTVDDESGAGRSLTLHNSPTFHAGKVGSNCIEFNGTNQYAQADVPVGPNGTIAFWLQLTGTPTAGDVFVGLGVNTSSTNGTWRSVSYHSGGLSFFGRGSTNEDILNWGGSLTVGRWYHVAITWDAANLVSCYLDGVLFTAQTKSGLKAPASELSLGGRLNAGPYYAPCKLDEVAVWSRALSANEISNLRALQKGWENPTTPANMTGNEALYHLEGNGNDNSGSGNNLTLYNSPTFPAGYVGTNCIEFNGVNQYAEADVSFTRDGTIACWVQLTSTPANGDVFVGFGPTTITGTGTWRAFSWYNGGFSFFGYSADILNWFSNPLVGQWYHVVITWNSANLVSCYVDGVLITSQTISSLVSSTSRLTLGGRTLTSSYYAPCKLDEVAVWSRAISSAEVASLYALQEVSIASPTTPIDMTDNAVLYHCDEASGTVGTDDSGNAKDAVLSGINTGTVAGKHGDYAWEFTGSTSVATSTVAVGSNWTIAMWFYNLAPNTAWRSGARQTASPYHCHIIVESGGDRLGIYGTPTIAFHATDTGYTMPAASFTGWHHIAAVGTGGNTIFYVDGVKVGTVVGSQPTNPIDTFGNYGLNNQRFADRLDEIAVWQRALSASEIEDIYIKQNGEEAGPRTSTFTFTPDVSGTYTVELSSTAQGGFSGSATADAVIAAASGAGSNSRYGLLSGLRLNRDAVFSGNVVKRIVKRKK